MEKGLGRRIACGVLGFVAGCGVVPDPTSLDTYVETYVVDVSPPRGDSLYAQKIYLVSDNCTNREKLLGDPDWQCAEFLCSAENPANITLGFDEGNFSRVTISGEWSNLFVEGYSVSPISLGGIGEMIRFVRNSEYGESGWADSRTIEDIGGEIQIDVGRGNTYFQFKAWPVSGEKIVKIDYLKKG